jgi:hypothetical protein
MSAVTEHDAPLGETRDLIEIWWRRVG